MKKLIFFLALAAFTLNAHAQLNKKWSVTHSLSGGVYKSAPVGITGIDGGVYTFSNEYYEATEDSIKGVIRKVDSTGALLLTTVLPAISVSAFPAADQHLAGIVSAVWLGGGVSTSLDNVLIA